MQQDMQGLQHYRIQKEKTGCYIACGSDTIM